MSQTITVANFYQLNLKELSVLDASASAGVSNLTLAFTDNFASDDLLYIGNYGGESSELLTISAVTNKTTIALNSATTKPHNRFDPAVTLFGDQIKLYRASNIDGKQPALDAFTVLGSPTAIDYDQVSTAIIDADGSDAYWYTFTYCNSISSAESNLGDSLFVRGGNIGNYCSVSAIRHRAGLDGNRYITDGSIDVHRQAAQMEINGNLLGLYTIPFAPPINPLIKEIAIKLSAGFVLLDDYGPVSIMDTTNGQKMIDDARATLARIKDKELLLPDVLGTDTSIDGANSFVAWPDQTTEFAPPDVGGGPRKFRVSDRY